MNYPTNYKKAVNWLNPSLILCNEICEVDESVYENMRFELEDKNGDYVEIYQWFLTSLSFGDMEYLERHFGLHFTYSNKLDLYVLCVPHYGTSWDYVYWTTDLEQASCELGD